MATVDDIASELFSVAERTAASASPSRTFKLSAKGEIKEISQAAAEEIVNPRRFGARSTLEANLTLDERVDHARSAMRRLVETMADHAGTIPKYAPDRLGERTLAYAMYSANFCPCWPIC
jgi:hypothetical protein